MGPFADGKSITQKIKNHKKMLTIPDSVVIMLMRGQHHKEMSMSKSKKSGVKPVKKPVKKHGIAGMEVKLMPKQTPELTHEVELPADAAPKRGPRPALRSGPLAFATQEAANSAMPAKMNGSGRQHLSLFEVMDTDGCSQWTWAWTFSEAVSRAAQHSGWTCKRHGDDRRRRRNTVDRLAQEAAAKLTPEQRNELAAKLTGRGEYAGTHTQGASVTTAFMET